MLYHRPIEPEMDRHRREEERAKAERLLARATAVANGEEPKDDAVESEEDDDDEPKPDATLSLPRKQVPLVVGNRGETIKRIEARCKVRIQIQKDEEELTRAFGSGGAAAAKTSATAPEAAADGSAPARQTVIWIYGEDRGCAMAKEMISEIIEAEKAKKRQRNYDAKNEKKKINRQARRPDAPHAPLYSLERRGRADTNLPHQLALEPQFRCVYICVWD